MRLPTVLAPLLAAAAAVAAPEPLNPPVPLAPQPFAVSAGEAAHQMVSAERAQALGFPSTAVTLYRSLLALPGADTRRLTLALSSALLDDGDVAGAGKVLDAYPGARNAGWHLREGLVAAHLQRTEQAKAEFGLVRADELEPAERGWYLFLGGMLADADQRTRAGRRPLSAGGLRRRSPTCRGPGSCSRRSRCACAPAA